MTKNKTARPWSINLSEEEEKFIAKIQESQTGLIAQAMFIANTITRLERMEKETWNLVTEFGKLIEKTCPSINPIDGRILRDEQGNWLGLDDKETPST